MTEGIADALEISIAETPSGSEQQQAIASGNETPAAPTVEELQKQLEAEKRRAATYEGNARSLRDREQALQSQIDQLTNSQKQMVDQFERMQEEATVAQRRAAIKTLQDRGIPQEEINRALALVEEGDRIEKAKADIEKEKARLKPAALALELQNYFDEAIDDANADLRERNVVNLITASEVKAALQGTQITHAKQIERAVRKLTNQRLDERTNAVRADKLDERAKTPGADAAPKGSKTISSLAEAEVALHKKQITPAQFSAYAREARKKGTVGYF